jgi:subtilisin family serine protease
MVTGANGNKQDPNSDKTNNRASEDTTYALVQLRGDPLSTNPRTHPTQGKKIDFNNSTVKSVRAQLSAERNDFKSWLRTNAPSAKVTGEYDISLNAVSVQLNGESLATIASAPLVQTAQYEGLYYPDDPNDPDLGIISAQAAWNQGGGPANAGQGVEVAVVDTGIDITHPCFNDATYPSHQQYGDHHFTNNKVIAAKVFNNKTPSHHYTPEALQDHGTHVAGTIGCNLDTPATVDGVTIPYAMSGVAPRVLLGNYNVFPGDVTNARSEDIMNALEAAYADGFDVANMSLGGNSHGNQDLLTVAVNDLDQANMVVAVAAGNSGPGHYTVESPGSAARALTAGASTVGHFIGAPITVAGTTYEGAIGDFAVVTSDLTAPLGVVLNGSNLDTACSPLQVNLTGKIGLVARGVCSFSTKIRNVQDAGGVAAIVANNVGGAPIAMGQDGTPNQPTIPAYMVSHADGQALMTHDGESTTIGATLQYFYNAADNDIMAGFSGQGPTDVDFRVKPDVVAPGVNVLSSIPHQFCASPPCFAFFQGTSMATPHLAGSAAIVKWLHPDWAAWEIRSAVVNTADKDALKKSDGVTTEHDVNVIGAGRENLNSAGLASVALDPVSVSFGSVPAGSGQTRNFPLTLTNVTNSAETLDLAISNLHVNGVTFSVSQSTVNLAPGGSTTVTLTMTSSRGAPVGDDYAWLTINSGGTEVAHAAVYVFIKQ